ncbi:MAG TPA: tetratricopeptide repeat protein [Verrucomicrobiales bacterium]|nr:tetratricopeptide repeat protein [Verrucomicrobiales bacterium]
MPWKKSPTNGWIRLLAACWVLSGFAGLWAQGVDPGEESPEVDDREVRRARVVEEPPSGATGAPRTVPPPRTAPRREAQRPAGPRPNQPSTGDPKKDMLDYANLLYDNGYHDLAIIQFNKFVSTYPGTEPSAHYRLGEAYRKNAELGKAQEVYERTIAEFRAGEYVGASAYRLASLKYNLREFAAAQRYYEIAERHLVQPEVRLSAAYYRARTLQHLGRNRDAGLAYQSLIEAPNATAYREPALLALARIEAQEGRKEEALARFLQLRDSALQPRIRAEAVTKAGILYSDLDRREEGNRLFEEALAMETGADEWRPAAHYGLMSNLYQAEDYAGVISAFEGNLIKHSEETEGKIYLVAGNAYRKADRMADAIRCYNRVESAYFDRPEGEEAGYQKLFCLYKVRDSRLPFLVDTFLERQQKQGKADSSYNDLALLLKAEALFTEKKYAEAANAYDKIELRDIPDQHHASVLFKKGWAQLEAQEFERAAAAFTRFLTEFPDDERALQGLVKRAQAYKGMQVYDKALEDYARIVEDYPESELAELSLQQVAFIRGQQQDVDGMIAAFEDLLAKYPETRGAAEAHYWMGWGRYENKEYAQAVPALEKARQQDPAFYDRASLRIILSYYYQKDVDNLLKEINVFLERKSDQTLPPEVFAWLGVELFQRDDFSNAVRLLELAVDPNDPARSPDVVWDSLGRSYLKLGRYQKAVEPFDIYLKRISEPARRARVLLNKGSALNQSGEYALARECAEEALRLEKEGRTNAYAWILLGDIAMEEKNYTEASRCYIIPSQMFSDPQVTPEALAKAANAFDQLGETDRAAEARAQLQSRYPDFKPE